MTDPATQLLAIAIAVAVCVLANWPIAFFVDECWKKLGWASGGSGFARTPWLVSLVGIFERCLFLLSLSVGQPEFIGLWLTLKVAAQWNQWSANSVELSSGRIAGRALFQVFLLGNSLSIFYSFLAFKVLAWIPILGVVEPALAFLVSAAATSALGLLVRWRRVT